MLTSYPVACPHDNCDWTGNVIPSHLQGGPDAEIVSMHRAWFRCPRCQGDWEVRITDETVTVLPVTGHVGSTRVPDQAQSLVPGHTLELDRNQIEDPSHDNGGEG